MGGMNNDWLSQLAADHAPAAIGWWPPAPGWWGVAVLLLVTSFALTWWWLRPTHRLRRRVLRELQRIEHHSADDSTLAVELEHLLRRYALTRYGRTQVAGLTGEAWIAFVIAKGGKDWGNGSGAKLLRAAYGGPVEADRQRWLAGAHAFVRARA